MKIIKRGVDPRTKIHRETCWQCKTVVEFTIEDENVEVITNVIGQMYIYYICPVCELKVCFSP